MHFRRIPSVLKLVSGKTTRVIWRRRRDLKSRLDMPLTCTYANSAEFSGDFDITRDHTDHAR